MVESKLFERICWHEGMLLSPQHFQQESTRVDALVAWQALAAQPAAWGVRRLALDEGRLSKGVLCITAIEAILPNGMAVCYDAAKVPDAALELDLTAYAAHMARQDVPVYLVVGAERSLRLPGQPAMFRRIDSKPVEDEVSEALADEVPRMAANLTLMAHKEPGSNYVHLCLLTLRKENESVCRGPFWPAQLEVPADAPLRRRAHQLAERMRSKAEFLGRQTVLGASSQEERLTMLEQQARLSGLTVNLPLLEAALNSPVVQPLPLYLALCAQLGPLAVLRPGALPLEPPRYVHADSYQAFDAVLNNLQELVGKVSQEWQTHTFSLTAKVFALSLPQEWLDGAVDGELVVGLRGWGERELTQWMAGAAIGSRTVSTSLGERRVLGAARRRIDGAPELGLRGGAGCTLFAITVSNQFIVGGQDLLISNINELHQAHCPQQIVLFTKARAEA